MVYVVEIRRPSGGKASKEYEAVSLRALIRLVDLELRNFPNCETTNIRARADLDMPVSSDDW